METGFDPIAETLVDVGPLTLADALVVRDMLTGRCLMKHGDGATEWRRRRDAVGAFLTLRIAQAERAAVLELRAEADELLPILPDPVVCRPDAFPTKWRGVPGGRWV